MEIIKIGNSGSSINQPIEITSQEMFDKILNYIHQNPVVAGFVIKPEDWTYSSVRDFCSPDIFRKKGLDELNYS